jgi:hypothetical protein
MRYNIILKNVLDIIFVWKTDDLSRFSQEIMVKGFIHVIIK